MKQKKIPKERNQFVQPSMFRKAGKHKLTRRKEQRNEKKDDSFSLLGLKL